jgi:ATP-binding cassette, subfamily B, bacterial
MSDGQRFEEDEFSTQLNGGTIRRLLGQLKPYKRAVAVFLACSFGVSLLESYFTRLTMHIVDDGIVANNPDVLHGFVAQYAGLMFVFAGMVFTFIYVCGILGHRVQYDLRKRMFNHLQRLSFSYYDRKPVGWIMSRLTSDPERVANVLTWGFLDVTWAFTNIVMSIFFMATISWQLAIIVALIMPVIIRVAIWFKQRILVEYRDVRKLNSIISGEYNEMITGVRVIKSMRRENKNLEEFSNLTHSYHRSAYRAAFLSALFLPTVQIISAVAVGAVAWYGGWQVSNGHLTIGGIQAFVAYITFMMWPVQDIARVYADLQHAIASAERMFSLLDSEPEVVDKPNASDPHTLLGEIEFQNVDFFYDPAKPVLQDFSLKIKQGETVALVGATGGGKSTIVNLLCRFYEPRAGRILIGGEDYTDFTLHGIHSRIGMVLQTPHLFSGTIRENIRYGRLDASDAEVEEAAKVAGAHAFIATLEKGYDEEVGEGGILLSVGQKQLLSLARAVLANPEIFIMDEATSSVDTLTEALIQQGMDQVMKGRTSFVIAHRLSTIKRADKIVVISDGKITEMGSHADLLRKKGYYYNLYTQQFRQELERSYDEVFKIKSGERDIDETLEKATA